MSFLSFGWRRDASTHNARPYLSNHGRITKTKHTVGIISRCQESDLKWLVDLLRSDPFEGIVGDVRHLLITNTNAREWKSRAERCTVGILYHTKRHGRVNVTDVPNAMYEEELTFISERYGRERVLVVLDDMEQIDDDEKQRILSNQPKIWSLSSELLLIPHDGKEQAARCKLTEIWRVLGGESEDLLKYNETSEKNQPGKTPERETAAPHPKINSSRESLKTSQNLKHGGGPSSEHSISTTCSGSSGTLNSSSANQSAGKQGYSDQRPVREHHGKTLGSAEDDTQTHQTLTSPDHQISIYSRCPESHYKWLMEKLKAGGGSGNAGHDVRAVCITNTYSNFTAEIPRCTFAILYHTQRWGRINISDIADSLYDNELRDLAQCLGRDNVIVVIDDMKVTSSVEMEKILEQQPSIKRWTKELILFDTNKTNVSEKMEKMRETIKNGISSTDRTWKCASNDTESLDHNQKILETSCGAVNQQGDWEETGNKRQPTSAPCDARPGEGYLPEFTKELLEKHNKETRALIQRFSQELLESQLAQSEEKERGIKGLTKALQDKERAMQEQTQSLKERECTIQEKERTIQKQVQSLKENECKIQDLTKVLQDNKQSKQALEQALQKKDRAMQEKERTMQDMKRSLHEKERTIQEKERTIQEKEHTIQDLKQSLREKVHTIQNQKQTLEEQEGITKEMSQELEERERKIKRLELQNQTQPAQEKRDNKGAGEASNNKVTHRQY
uniref:Uncharacterized protein n=1 Tax=Leptobrachium leishanense TaxID=445787 RepID=A0A8C5QIC0_9ANUR